MAVVPVLVVLTASTAVAVAASAVVDAADVAAAVVPADSPPPQALRATRAAVASAARSRPWEVERRTGAAQASEDSGEWAGRAGE